MRDCSDAIRNDQSSLDDVGFSAGDGDGLYDEPEYGGDGENATGFGDDGMYDEVDFGGAGDDNGGYMDVNAASGGE